MNERLTETLRHASITVSQWPTWKQNILRDSASPTLLPTEPAKPHLSFESAEVGSFIHACEAWILGERLHIPPASRKHLYQAMQDEFMESDAYALWQADQAAFYKHVYGKRDKLG